MLLATLPRCEECDRPAPDGYRHATCKDDEPILRCRICFERRMARALRDASDRTVLSAYKPRKRLAL